MKRNFCSRTCGCGNTFTPTAGNQRFCRKCSATNEAEKKREYGQSNPRAAYKQHGVTEAQFEEWRSKGCALCDNDFDTTPRVDHDHRHCAGRRGCKECVRGLLCDVCNKAFVWALEKNPTLRKLVSAKVLEYIDKFQPTQPELLLS